MMIVTKLAISAHISKKSSFTPIYEVGSLIFSRKKDRNDTSDQTNFMKMAM